VNDIKENVYLDIRENREDPIEMCRCYDTTELRYYWDSVFSSPVQITQCKKMQTRLCSQSAITGSKSMEAMGSPTSKNLRKPNFTQSTLALTTTA